MELKQLKTQKKWGMGRVMINMVGGGFQHDVCSVAYSVPKIVEWDKIHHLSEISIYIDYGISNIAVNKNKFNYAWLAESKTINSNLYGWCLNNVEYLEDNFKYIFTHDLSMIPLSNIFKLILAGLTPWIKDVQIHKKTKLVSMITSNKKTCEEHIYRNEIANKFRNSCDLFGRGYNEIERKEIGLNDYCFSIVMENGRYPYMFTEKLSDCFATGTIPVYYGCDEIGEFFDEKGIIKLIDDFDINELNFDLYHSKMQHIKNNFNKLKELQVIPEDQIYEKYIKEDVYDKTQI